MVRESNDLTSALNTFHNRLFSKFKLNNTKEDAKILEDLLNYISSPSSDNAMIPETIQDCLTQSNLQEAKIEIQKLLQQKFPNLQSLSANEYGDWAEHTVALLGQILSGMNFKDLDLSKGVVGDNQRIRQIPEKVKDYIQKQYLNTSNKKDNKKWSSITNSLSGKGFVFTSPVQAKVDVDYTVFSQNMTIQSDMIKRLLSYRISVKETAGSTAKLEIINIYAALLSCYAAVYPTAQAAHIARFYLERKMVGEQFLIHADHVAKLSALTGFGSINENTQTVSDNLLILPDLLAGYNSNTCQWHVESVAEIVQKIPESKKLLNNYDLGIQRIKYNFSSGTFTK